MTKLLVIGATQGIGRATVTTALDRGLSVRAMARGIEALEIEHPALDKHRGDATEAEDLRAALDGVDAVAMTLGVPIDRQTLTRPVALFSTATATLIPLMRETGPRRLVAVTGFGTGDSHGRMSFLERAGHWALLGRIYDDKSRQETLIREASDLDWTIARPVILTNGQPTGRYRVLVAPGEWRNGLISRADVADFVVRSVVEGTYIRQTPVLAR
ncbi:MAG: NAD(P)-dependent oxidoreductase [Paracoccaceae bacterium]